MEESEPALAQFVHNYNAVNTINTIHAVNTIHENTCYKSMNNPSCIIIPENTCYKSMNNPSRIDHIITNSPNSFQSTSTFCTGLFDFHKLVVTVLKISFRKTAPKEIH